MKSAGRAAKSLIKGLLLKAGYELLRKDRFGSDALTDIKTLYGSKPFRIVFDVGAHEGETMVEFRQQFPNADIYCFEPYEKAFEILEIRSEKDMRIKIYNYALGEYDGWATLFCNSRSHWNSLLKNSKDIEKLVPKALVTPVGTETIKVCKLDTFCEDNNIENIDLLKMDVQGYELRVLNGASNLLKNKKINIIYLEVLFAPYYVDQSNFEDIFLYLKSLDYKLVGLYYLDYGRRDDMSLLWCDAIFIA